MKNTELPTAPGAIGVFDSGYGGLTILRDLRKALPQYDYVYFGDNARAPYGTRSFELVYQFTLEAVRYLFSRGCHLVILACNTASAKALRSIQQRDLPGIDSGRRVLGVIRPTVEWLGEHTVSRKVGVLGTPGTIASQSYEMETEKLFPDIKVFTHACPMWVPLVENSEHRGDGADYFVEKDVRCLMSQCADIDTVVLGCTHYPMLLDKIKKYMPSGVRIVSQGEIVAASLADYLVRHPEMERKVTRGGTVRFLTTEQPSKFESLARTFMGCRLDAEQV